MVKLQLNPKLNSTTEYEVGTILKPTNTMLLATGRTITTSDIYCVVVEDDTDTCTDCFLKSLSTQQCCEFFSCVRHSGSVVLRACDINGKPI